ncbi:MAG TPA: hypothetical protein VK116_19695 [Planctomycetota bacterium]|nr:hypothetical protein [Planctomycetota bacterium]
MIRSFLVFLVFLGPFLFRLSLVFRFLAERWDEPRRAAEEEWIALAGRFGHGGRGRLERAGDSKGEILARAEADARAHTNLVGKRIERRVGAMRSSFDELDRHDVARLAQLSKRVMDHREALSSQGKRHDENRCIARRDGRQPRERLGRVAFASPWKLDDP